MKRLSILLCLIVLGAFFMSHATLRKQVFHSSQELSGKCAVQMRCRSGSLLACYQRYLYGTR